MSKIIGNTTATPNPRPDWNQTDDTKADYIKNKPTVLTEEDVVELITENGGVGGSGVYVGSGDMPDGYNVQIDPTGEVLVIDQNFNPTSTNPQSGKAVAEAVASVSGGSTEKWVQLVNDTLQDNLATEYLQVFDKPYKKLRFKIVFKRESSISLSNVCFKRAKADGKGVATSSTYLKLNVSGTATTRVFSATASFDVDNSIVITDACLASMYSMLYSNNNTFGSEDVYTEEKQNFPEFYFYLGGSIADDGTFTGNVIGKGTTIKVWGCE